MKNKSHKKQKKSFSESMESVSDYVDLLSQIIAEYFNKKYKIEKKVEDIKNITLKTLFNLKKEFIDIYQD